MKKSERFSQNGSVTLTVLLIIMALVIGALIYILLTQQTRTSKTSRSIIDIEQTEPARPTTSERASNYPFDDGLKNPDSTTQYQLDEFGAGLSYTNIFNIDINADGRKDRISRSRYENGTDHFYYDYTVELSSKDTYVNITPDYFRTTEGAECSLQKLRFSFQPIFQVIKISRPWEESWITPSAATKTTYRLSGNTLKDIATQPLKKICNVSDLF